jgi:hypothetical protein
MILNQRYFAYLMALGLLLTGTEAVFAGTPLPANMMARAKISATKVLFRPPAHDRRPLRTVGAGSRGGQCAQDFTSASGPSRVANTLPLLALVPPSNVGLTVAEVQTSNVGLTVAERPTFWMYVPQTSAKKVVLTLQSEDTSSHFQWSFPVPSTAGIVSLQPPTDAPPLKIGQTYQWAVVLVCGERPSPNDPAIAAWVKRISPAQSIPQSTALSQAAWYGEQGLWYDMLTALGQELRSQPTNPDLTNIWANVLKSQGLEIVAMEPLRQE